MPAKDFDALVRAARWTALSPNLDIEEKQDELARRQRHYEEIRGQLQRERTRILEHLLPARFGMAGEAQAFPVALEIRLPDRRV